MHKNKHYTLPVHRDAIPTAESHLAGLYSSLRRANSSGKETAALSCSRPPRGCSSNGGGGRTTAANSTLLPRVVEDNVVAIDAEVKQSLMELLLGRHAVVRGGGPVMCGGVPVSIDGKALSPHPRQIVTAVLVVIFPHIASLPNYLHGVISCMWHFMNSPSPPRRHHRSHLTNICPSTHLS